MRLSALIIVALISHTGCSTASQRSSAIVVEDIPARNVIMVTNRSRDALEIYYNHIRSFGSLQMFYVRFRGADQVIVPLDGERGNGWFTPKFFHQSLLRRPQRERLMIPPLSSVEFERDVASFITWASWSEPQVTGPCEIQFKLYGYLDNNERRPIEAVSEWRPSPCPVERQ
jgi:hypothetical protein